MKTTFTPVRTTVVYGLIAALLFVPVGLLTRYTMFWHLSLCLSGWAGLAAYALLLVRWSGAKTVAVIFPLILLLAAPFAVHSAAAWFAAALLVLSWIRSGICFKKPLLRSLLVELFIGGGGMLLVALLGPRTVPTWTLGIWLFFLVQALYFLLMGQVDSGPRPTWRPDPFEQARRKAECILSEAAR
jgi:hypothetical protein